MILETDKLSVILLCMIFFFFGGGVGVEWGWGVYSEKLEKNTFNENKVSQSIKIWNKSLHNVYDSLLTHVKEG